MKDKGYTLVEVLITFALVAITGGMLFSMLGFSNKSAKELTITGKLHYIEEYVLSEIMRGARSAEVLLGPGESYTSGSYNLAVDTVDTVHFYGNNLDFTAIALQGSTILEKVEGQWRPFQLGNNPITVVPGGGFLLSSDRKEVTVLLQYFDQSTSDTIFIPLRGGSVRCRN